MAKTEVHTCALCLNVHDRAEMYVVVLEHARFNPPQVHELCGTCVAVIHALGRAALESSAKPEPGEQL